MAQSQIPVGSALARKLYGTALFSRIIQAPAFTKNITGEAPGQAEAESKQKGQTAPGMPIVRVTDLSKTQGDTVSVDLFDTIKGKPLVGDRQAEGTGESLVSSSMDVRIDLLTKVVDSGGKMTNQRTVHDLRGICMSQLAGYFPRLYDQAAITHLSGGRGSLTGRDWILPTSSDADFTSILVNGVKAPTYNRHYVINGTALTQGGAQLGSIASTDDWNLTHVDQLSLLLDDLEFPFQAVKVPDDPAADDEPIKAILWLTPRQWYQLQTDTTSGYNWRTFLQNAWERKSYGSKHPLFNGNPGLWNGILIKRLPRYTVRFAISETTKVITSGNRYTATETDQAVNGGLSAGYAVERALLTGAQALAHVYGRNQSSGFYFSWLEHKYNFERNLEVAADAMFGMAKLRFSFVDGSGNVEPTDNGVMVIDSAVKL